MLYLMSKDCVIAKFDNDSIHIENYDLLPLYFREHKSLSAWLEKRAIDSHRTNSRLLKKALRLKGSEKTDAATALKFNAVTITDTYWVKARDSTLTYADVRFTDNYFDALALKGDLNVFNQQPSRTPELTNTGSFEKCWKLIDGEWWMYKSGTPKEYFSELFVCEYCKKMEFPTAEYEMHDGYIRTKDFTKNAKYNHEPISSLVDQEEDYSYNFDIIHDLHPEAAADYLRLLYTDTICYNVDRHTENYGLMRDPDTGEIISLSPNYDNNIALISRGPLNTPTENDVLINYYINFLQENPKAKQAFAELKLKILSREEIQECINNIPLSPDIPNAEIAVINIIEARQNLFWQQIEHIYM